jgi:serine/threonine protein kinase
LRTVGLLILGALTLWLLRGPVPPGRAIHFLAQACDSLAEGHALGQVHRDVKPSNLFICEASPDALKKQAARSSLSADTSVSCRLI